jgi:hypothetical protein
LRRMMSRAWVPIEPVEPRITTSRGAEEVTAPLCRGGDLLRHPGLARVTAHVGDQAL